MTCKLFLNLLYEHIFLYITMIVYVSEVAKLIGMSKYTSIIPNYIEQKNRKSGYRNFSTYESESEKHYIQLFEIGLPNKVSDRQKRFEQDFEHFTLVGKIDGTLLIGRTTYILEFKNRQYKIAGRISPDDKIQMECYLRLANLNKAKLIQSLGDTLKVIDYKKNDELWNDIQTKLTTFCSSHPAFHKQVVQSVSASSSVSHV